MKKKTFLFILMGFALLGTGFYKWDQARKLDNYFINQFALDYQTQVNHKERGHGEIFEKALEEMKQQGYNPYQIQEIMVQGFDKANQKLLAQAQTEINNKTS